MVGLRNRKIEGLIQEGLHKADAIAEPILVKGEDAEGEIKISLFQGRNQPGDFPSKLLHIRCQKNAPVEVQSFEKNVERGGRSLFGQRRAGDMKDGQPPDQIARR